MRAIAWLVVACLAGCQTPALDPNYGAALQAHQERERLWAAVAMERARAERERYVAIQLIGERGDAMARQTALMALAFVSGGGGVVGSLDGFAGRGGPIPPVPETQEDKALKWTQVLLGPTVGLVGAYYGFRMGTQQAAYARDTTIAGYNTISTLGTAGYGAVQNTAIAGFGAMGTLGSNALAGMARPNITLTNTGGVMGSGSYVGPNSGAFSGNSGRISSPDCPNQAGSAGPVVIGPDGTPVPTGSGGAATINCPGG